MAQPSARALALAALAQWRSGEQFADSIIQQLLAASSLTGSDRGFATELFYGTLRNLMLLDFWLKLLRPNPVDDSSRDLLRLGLYQLFCLRTPEHAAVFETVKLGNRKNRALVNAVLRSALRRADELREAAALQPASVRTSHPSFLVDRWSKTYGAEATATLCEWNNQPPPIYARINTLRTSLESFLSQNPTAEMLPAQRNFVRLASIPTAALDRGDCYIQDPSTTVACELLDPQPGDAVLDACAAPGGKTSAIAALMQNQGRIVACDRDGARVEILRENLSRLGVSNAETIRTDWQPNVSAQELQPATFDRVMVDAPCTNTGVMRRRVDVRWRLRPQDFERMPAEQLAIVRAVLPLWRPGGVLVYSTCSLEPEENEAITRALREEFPFLEMVAEKSVLPFRDHFDGAYAAKFIRR